MENYDSPMVASKGAKRPMVSSGRQPDLPRRKYKFGKAPVPRPSCLVSNWNSKWVGVELGEASGGSAIYWEVNIRQYVYFNDWEKEVIDD